MRWQTFLKRPENVGENKAKRRRIRPKGFKNNFTHAGVGNARVLSRVLCVWQTFLKRPENVGQNKAKRRRIRPKGFENNFTHARVGNGRVLSRVLCVSKLC